MDNPAHFEFKRGREERVHVIWHHTPCVQKVALSILHASGSGLIEAASRTDENKHAASPVGDRSEGSNREHANRRGRYLSPEQPGL